MHYIKTNQISEKDNQKKKYNGTPFIECCKTGTI